MEQASTKYSNPCKRLLPSEIIELILLRLPVKPLGRFKSVSKTWNSIISDPRFIKTHTHLTHNPKKLLALSTPTLYGNSICSIELTIHNTDTLPATSTEFTFISPSSRWSHIFGSCNGLVLAGVVKGRVYLMNPTTHEAWKLPKNPFEPEYSGGPNDIMCDVRYGFGYDSSTDDYKVVSICFFSRDSEFVESVSVYSVRDDSWRKLVTDTVPHAQPLFYTSCALVDGKCHWCAVQHSSSIIAFSFTDEVFSEIHLSDSLLGENLCRDVVEIGGKLAVYSSTRNAAGVEGDYELWVMQEYGDAKSWTRVCSHGDGWMMPVCLVEGSDQDIVIPSRYGVGVVLFNIDEKICRNVRIVGGPCEFSHFGGTFVESFESIERINTMTQRIKVMDN